MIENEPFDQRYVGYREFSTHRDEIKGELATVKISQAEQRAEIAHVGQQVSGVDKKLDSISTGLAAMSQQIARQPVAQPQPSELAQIARELAPMLKRPDGVGNPPPNRWWIWMMVGAVVLYGLMHYFGIKP